MTAPAVNFQSICDNLAARFAAAVMGTPTGAPAILASYGQYPKAVPALPAVIVEPQDGTVLAQASYWQHEMKLDAVLLLAKRPGNPATVEKYRQLYLPYLLAATEGQLQIGLGSQAGWSVLKAIPTGWTWVEYPYDGDEYDGIRVHYQVWANENVSLVP